MLLKFDWLIVLENLRSGIMVTDVNLYGPAGPSIIYVNHAWLKMTSYSRDCLRGKTPRILQGEHTDHAVVGSLKEKLLNRELFHGQTWNYRKEGEPFLMNWYCYAIFGERGKPVYYVAEQEDVTELESLRLKQRLLANPQDGEVIKCLPFLKIIAKNKNRSCPVVISCIGNKIVIKKPDPAFGDQKTSASMNHWRFKLLYDGECPLCRREALFLSRRNRNGWLSFEDIAAPGFDPAIYGATREELMGVIHGVFPDGRLIQRVAVFREAYRAVGLGWILAPTAWPGLRWLADRGYEWFARHRLTIGRLFGRHCPSGACVSPPPKVTRG
jgi:PAS domain S-box-containing protein